MQDKISSILQAEGEAKAILQEITEKWEASLHEFNSNRQKELKSIDEEKKQEYQGNLSQIKKQATEAYTESFSKWEKQANEISNIDVSKELARIEELFYKIV